MNKVYMLFVNDEFYDWVYISSEEENKEFLETLNEFCKSPLTSLYDFIYEKYNCDKFDSVQTFDEIIDIIDVSKFEVEKINFMKDV